MLLSVAGEDLVVVNESKENMPLLFHAIARDALTKPVMERLRRQVHQSWKGYTSIQYGI